MKVRLANIEELPAIVDIYNQAILTGFKTADINTFTVEQRIGWFNDHMPDKYPIFVAVKDDVIAGYLTLSAYREGREAFTQTAEVSFYIDEKYQRKNIGTELLQHAIDHCPALNIKNLIAMLIEGNQESISLLEKFGFEKWGHLPNIAVFENNEVSHLYFGLKIS